jgi:cytosine/adenosine deaminase-related metal-dependent hydrolase
MRSDVIVFPAPHLNQVLCFLHRVEDLPIEPGKAADLVLFNTNRLEFAGSVSDPLAMLVVFASNHFADTTIVNGEIFVEDGRLITLDEDEVTARANELTRAFKSRLSV